MSLSRLLILCSVLVVGFVAGYSANQVVSRNEISTTAKAPSGKADSDVQYAATMPTSGRLLRGAGANPCPSRTQYKQNAYTGSELIDIIVVNRKIAVLTDYYGHSMAAIIDALDGISGALTPDGVKQVFGELRNHKDPDVRAALVGAMDPEKDKELLAELLIDDNDLVRKSVVERLSKDSSEPSLKASKRYIEGIIDTETDEDVLISIMDFFHSGFPSEADRILTLGDSILQRNNLSPDDLVHVYETLTDIDVSSEAVKKLIISSPSFLSIPQDSKDSVIRRIAAVDMALH